MATSTATETLAALRNQLLAQEVPCDVRNLGNQHPAGERCPHCHGTGTQPRFPLLRVECHGGHKWTPMTGYSNERKIPCSHPQARCLGYIWNPDPDAINEAIRAAGWRLKITANPMCDGDFVAIERWPDDLTEIRVATQEGLRGQVAVITAMLRACGAA